MNNNRIKELRKQQKKTLQQVADGVGASNGTIANYENGKREPKLETWQKLADYFGVPVGYIQGVTEIRGTYSYKGYESNMEQANKQVREFNVDGNDTEKYVTDFDYRYAQDEKDGSIDIALAQYKKISGMFNAGNESGILADKKSIARLMYIIEHITDTAEFIWDYSEQDPKEVDRYLMEVSNQTHIYGDIEE